MINQEQKDRNNRVRREKYASDPEFRKRCREAVALYQQKKKAEDPDYKNKLLSYSRAYRARKRKARNTFFRSITISPETLAEQSVYLSVSRDGKYYTYSSPWIYSIHLTKEEAVTATIKKLKEVME